MIPDTEKWVTFEGSECWGKILGILQDEMNKNIGDVRANVRITGKECEASYAAGRADAFELVSRLPENIKKQLLAKKGKPNE
jgi:hypothetical protein